MPEENKPYRDYITIYLNEPSQRKAIEAFAKKERRTVCETCRLIVLDTVGWEPKKQKIEEIEV